MTSNLTRPQWQLPVCVIIAAVANVLLCRGPNALAVDIAPRWRPVGSSKGLAGTFSCIHHALPLLRSFNDAALVSSDRNYANLETKGSRGLS